MVRASHAASFFIAVAIVVGSALPVRGSMAAPAWTPGDYWEYDASAQGGAVTGTLRLDVVGAETATVGGVPYASYRVALDERLSAFGTTLTATGVVWYRTSDYAPVAQFVNATIVFPPNSTRVNVTAAFDSPQRIQWPLTPGDSWTATGWVNSSVMVDVPPPTWTNVTITTSFTVGAEGPVTVPAGTFATTPLRGTSDGYANVTYWSPTVGNGVLVQAFDPSGFETQRLDLTSYRYQAAVPGNAYPSVTLTSPIGGEAWSGGSVHDIAYTTSDPDNATLDVTVEWSEDGGATWAPVASFPAEPTGGHTYPWTVPFIDTTTARLRVCASDRVNPSVCATTTKDLAIDSTRPVVVGRDPSNAASNVALSTAVTIEFSETMSRTPTQAAITIAPAVSGITFQWSEMTVLDDTLAINHNDFAPCTSYTVTVVTGARDVSDPGNGFAADDTWTFNTACAPMVTLSSPAGGEVWSGGSAHDVTFTTADSDLSLRVWVNLSTDGGASWTTLSGPSLRGTGTVTITVTLPTTDTTNARIRVTAQDSTALDGIATSLAFAIDAIAPTVASTNPTQGATNVAVTTPITVTLSEPMDTASVEAAMILTPSPGALTFSWDPTARTITIDHPVLQTATQYTLTITTNARDASDPGNTMASTFTLTVITSAAGAVTADAGGPYSGEAEAVIRFDGTGSSGAIVNYTWEVVLPSGSVFLYGEGPTFTTSTVGTFVVALTVGGASGGTDTDTTSLTIEASDTTPPVILHTPPGAVVVGQPIPIRASVTDDHDVLEVRLVYTPVGGTEQNVTMTHQILPSGEPVWTYTIPGQSSAGTVTYQIYAVDAEGNAVITQQYAVTVRTLPSAPAIDFFPVVFAAILVAALLIAALIYFRRRKASKSPPTR